MIKKNLIILFLAAITLGSGLVVANALTYIGVESVLLFDSAITVNTDNSINVTETILYNTGPLSRHGIYRDIYTLSSQKRKMGIDIISVTDDLGNPHNYTVTNNGDYVRVKIGDADKTFTGQRMYTIRYRASRAVAQFEEFDEIYWNVTGNEWNMPIYQAETRVSLPNNASSTQYSCYYGPKGSTAQCQLAGNQNNEYTFGVSPLDAQEGLTVAVGFAKGIVEQYSTADNASNFFAKYWRWLVSALIPILTLVFTLRHWYKNGRDPKGTGVIIPQYDVPDGLTPMEVGGIVNEVVNAKQISAEIIYLATKGYLKINQLEEKTLGIFKHTDYELVKLKEADDLPNESDKVLLNSLFKLRIGIGLTDVLKLFRKQKVEQKNISINEIKLSSLKNHFYTDIPKITGPTISALKKKGYYKNLGKMKSMTERGKAAIVMSILGAFILAFLVIGPLVSGSDGSWIGFALISYYIYFFASLFFAARTEKGVLTKEYLLGLKDYLQIAEKDRLHFHNAPEKKPEVFEKLLPYAMVLGVADIWAKEFEGIYVEPNWYSGPAGSHFTAATFANDMSSFSSMASSSLSSSPSGSGSGGGGSSGGGGGGGGGGGW